MLFNVGELDEFISNGVVIKRGFVQAGIVNQAMRLITEWYSTRMDPRQLTNYTHRTFAPELGNHPDVLSLFNNSGAMDLAKQLVGQIAPVTISQIQIRIPEVESLGLQPVKTMHVDGVACPHLDPNELRTFSLLVGIVLSEINDPEGGALRYIAGGHVKMAEWFRREWKLGLTNQVPPYIDQDKGTPLLGNPGDLLLMHHLIPHAAGRNHTTTARVMVYFRVSHIDHSNRRLDSLRDPWLDYPPLNARARRQMP